MLPVYILDDVNSGECFPGAASRWWLHHSLHSLNRSLQNRLVVLQGDPLQLLPQLTREHGVEAVYWNRCYEPWRIQLDQKLEGALQDAGTAAQSFNAALLWEPWQILKGDQTPYQVFTPFFRQACQPQHTPALPAAAPANLELSPVAQGSKTPFGTAAIDALQLLPEIAWDKGLHATWQPGEQAARQRLQTFLDAGLYNYREGRNYPALRKVSRLSPHLHFGEISVREVWHEAMQSGITGRLDTDLECFRAELGWREFSHYQLYHRPDMVRGNIQRRFDQFPFLNNPQHLHAWQQGQTGFPLVDAGMRELWQTGYMHNRVRMIAASFLVKNLRLHWHHGADWFWDCLVDADLASNTASWQWVAGCGADAAPYFRIFNPVTQSQKFDAQGTYIRQYVPELAQLPDRYIHDPGSAPQHILQAAGVTLGTHYPAPLVDLKTTREAALDAYKSL